MTFSLWIGLGAALGLGWMALKSPAAPWLKGRPPGAASRGRPYAHLDAGLWALLAGIAGGRAVYVAAAWPYFAAHPVEIPQVWLGGLSGPGAAAGAALGAGLFAAARRAPLAALADALLPLAMCLAISGWLACWQMGCAYGAPVAWGLPAPDEWGAIARRFPVQLLGALLALATFAILDASASPLPPRLAARLRGAPPGVLAGGSLCLLAFETAGLCLLRADPAPLLFGLRLDALGWALLATAGLATWGCVSYFRSRRDGEPG